MTYITRAIEPIVERRFKTSKCLAIVGARQVGKSTLIGHIYPELKKVNLKSPTLMAAAKNSPSLFLDSFSRPVFIDEVQECPELLSAAKAVLDEATQKGNYIFSGSKKWELMGDLGDSLAGMVSIVEIPTLSCREIFGVDFNNHFVLTAEYLDEREKFVKDYSKDIWPLIHGGFYPEQFDDDPRLWDEFYDDYVKTYLERDVYKIAKIRDSSAFIRFLVAVAARTGNIVNYSNIASDVGIDVKTAQSWMGILEKTNIVYLLKPYFNSHLNRAIKSEKIYFRDTGLAAYLCGWLTPETLRNGANSGAFFETFVIGEIIKSFINEGKDYTKYLFYYRGRSKVKKGGIDVESEIDLIIEENGVLYPMEIKKNDNPKAIDASAFTVLDADVDKKRGDGAIICLSKNKLKLRENLYVLPIEYV